MPSSSTPSQQPSEDRSEREPEKGLLAAVGVGGALYQARTQNGCSLEEIAWRLRIRPEILKALEDEQFDELGHEGFVRTNLRSYARAVGLDAGEITRQYRRRHASAGPSPIEALDEKDKVARKHAPRSRWVLAACLAAVLLVAGSIFGFLRGPGERQLAAQSHFPAGPRISFEQASRGMAPATTEKVVVRIAAVKATQMLVVVDGRRSFQGLLAPGASQLFTGIHTVTVDVTDSRAVSLWANGERVLAPAGLLHTTFRPRAARP